jgi:hypothetical protein
MPKPAAGLGKPRMTFCDMARLWMIVAACPGRIENYL